MSGEGMIAAIRSCADSDHARRQYRNLMAMRLAATAKLQTELAVALIGNGQDELRKHFLESAGLMLEAAKELSDG